MNIFFTNPDPTKCAQEHCTVHARKMIVEYAQMLSTAHRVLDGDEYADANSLYRVTHANHPSAKWVRECASNYQWLYDCCTALLSMFEVYSESERPHSTSYLMSALEKIPAGIGCSEFTAPPPAMPREYQSNNVCESYQRYLCSKYNEWLTRDKPIQLSWWLGDPSWCRR